MSIPQISVRSLITNDEFLNDVIAGLRSSPRTLPCKYFYDETGSRLFDEICKLDEYYLTRTELAIMRDHAAEIAERVGSEATIIEPGSGAGIKVQLLIDALDKPRAFIPFDISEEMLSHSAGVIAKKYPELPVAPVHGDFTDTRFVSNLVKHNHSIRSGNTLLFFPGSTIGNFNVDNAVQLLDNFRRLIGNNGKILIGADLVKNEQTLINAYDDAAGLTAEFNKNILYRINHELNGNFDIDNGFAHQAVFNREKSRIEMHLVSLRDQRVVIDGDHYEFRKGETIHTENSHKYSMKSFSKLAANAGLQVTGTWTDKEMKFAQFMLEQ